MIVPRSSLVGLSLATLLVCAFGPPVYSAQTTITIATSNASGGLGLSIPSINDSGLVAFINTSPGTNGLYAGNGGPLTTYVTSSTYFIGYGKGPASLPNSNAAPAITNGGLAAFWAYTGPSGGSITSNLGILTATPGNVSTIVAGSAPIGSTGTSNYTNSPLVDEAGTTVFAANRTGGFSGAGLFSGSGGALSTIVSTSDHPYTPVDPAISHNGTIAYSWPTFSSIGVLTSDSLYLVHNGVTTTLATVQFPLFSSIAVNDAGTVAVTTDTRAIQIDNGSGLNTLVDGTGSFVNFGALSLNDAGHVAFYASLAAGGAGIFTGTDPVNDKIIAVGDSLAGSTVVELGFGREGLNDQGQVAFWAALANGQQGVFVVNPVPEPSSLMLLAFGGLACLAGRCAFTRRGLRPVTD